MKVRVKYKMRSYHPKLGLLRPGDVVDVPDDFPIEGSSLFEKVNEEAGTDEYETENEQEVIDE